ncbi:(2Fe-2S)-binding protein [Weizmannia acidilactici]|uniref:(2Fe-2S)-binding protein n=1 Tax=Weizmannia acidilactici TaxID=2607726 RepID=A0A5J4JJK5_9BACI|nr:FAD-dependent oxidoreductase [Weizmannia acidilactici]GER70915.1 (2Fe-2S)-binding protein [Weizmannia acidilactici]
MNEKSIPHYPEPIWRKTVSLPRFPSLQEDIEADVAVAGAGMAGIVTAYLLAKEGIKTVLFDAGEIANGTSGHTTAKITAQHGLVYDELIQHIGIESAGLYYKANEAAASLIKNIIRENDISCSFSHQAAFLYTNSDDYFEKLEKEMRAYDTLGIHGEWLDRLPDGIPAKKAVKMERQAQFHPLSYLKALVEFLMEKQVPIFENTTAKDIEYGNPIKIKTEKGHTISCNYVCICTHYPFYDAKGLYFTRMYPERSYLIAVKPEKPFPGGMYINTEQPTRSFREVEAEGEKLLLVGGENHKTGQGGPMIRHYEVLQEFAEKTFGIETFYCRWSAQDLTTLDKIPYIGPVTKMEPNVFIETGFRKWGMTGTHVAALIMRDLILQKENPYVEMFAPQRFEADPMVKNFVSANVDVAEHLVKGKFDLPDKPLEQLEPDEGAVVRINGKRAGAYKDNEGNIYLLDTTCTHMGCEVKWNSGERTWDCPCHGSRFSFTGEVVEGPAKDPLTKIEYQE